MATVLRNSPTPNYLRSLQIHPVSPPVEFGQEKSDKKKKTTVLGRIPVTAFDALKIDVDFNLPHRLQPEDVGGWVASYPDLLSIFFFAAEKKTCMEAWV